jgi:hypothetical protein
LARQSFGLGAPELKRLGVLVYHILGCATLTLDRYAPLKR